MKKVIVIFLVVLCSCGIGYLGYLIFRSKNIDTVELVGNIQTLYVVGDELDFEDAKLKVTYKNGNIRMVDLDSSSVEVTYFTTSVETHAKMNIIYKSAVIPVEFNVIQKGSYYLKNYSLVSVASANTSNKTNEAYTVSNTNEMIYIDAGGICKYYTKSANGWMMIDGNYNASLRYTITADTLSVNLSKTSYNIKVNYLDSGKMNLVSEKMTKIANTELVNSHETRVFEHTEEMKTTQSVGSVKVATNLLTNSTANYKVGQTISDCKTPVYLKVTYMQYNNGHQFRTIYVQVESSMISRNFVTSKKNTTGTNATLSYSGFNDIALFYKVS